MWFYGSVANVILVLHVSYVSFVVLGLLLIWLGIACRWNWIRNPWFRGIHLTMILIVVLESWIGMTCPLTTWENWFRKQAGQNLYDGDFIAIWLHDLIFLELPQWAFTVGYSFFGLAVVATLWLAPPRWIFASRNSGS
jgi:hypothetical protein